MTRQEKLIEAVVEWVSHERLGIDAKLFIAEVRMLAQHSADWPEAAVMEWKEAVSEAIDSGKVREQNGKLFIVRQRPEEKQDDSQMSLF